MGQFFKGWRRKVGAVTLLTACMFMGAWFRSSVVADTFFIFYDAPPPSHADRLRGVSIADTLMVYPQQTPIVFRSCRGCVELYCNSIYAADNFKDESEIAPARDGSHGWKPIIGGPSAIDGSSVVYVAIHAMGGPPVVDRGIRWITPRPHVGASDLFNKLPTSQVWNFIGFECGFERIPLVSTSGKEILRIAAYTLPYWSIVLPFTALCAFLLLSKPRELNLNENQ
jgi:hypothetical protein